ncbi:MULTISPECIES: IS66 family insertion sequence element accessory protein TnpB [Pseudomonadota]|uniref:IS66 family insertion sequence element accessory protein TnpB n=1 Tax=Pseudomonadota TaxID=1224 RepID=UPI002626CF81|nr:MULTISPECIES: IS66 family insertion sequence element accessory protein TnpB [Pseudomonadota]
MDIHQVWLVWEPVDMRAGIDRLSGLVQEALGRSPCDGTAYAFRNRRSSRLKLLVWDGNGVWLCQRRLHRGLFVWPREGEAVLVLTRDQWRWLITGVDWTRVGAAPHPEWRV